MIAPKLNFVSLSKVHLLVTPSHVVGTYKYIVLLELLPTKDKNKGKKKNKFDQLIGSVQETSLESYCQDWP